MTVLNTPRIYSAIPLTKSLVTLKTFLPMTTGSIKLTPGAPEENTVYVMQFRQLNWWLRSFSWIRNISTTHTIITEGLKYEAGTFCQIHYCVWHGWEESLEVVFHSNHSVVDEREGISAQAHRVNEANVNRSCNGDKTKVLKIPHTDLYCVRRLRFRFTYPSLCPEQHLWQCRAHPGRRPPPHPQIHW